jgi:hypothetical protein
MFNDEKKVSKKPDGSIIPKRDFHIFCNEDDIKLVKGERITVPVKYLPNLKTEKVI